MSSEPTLRDLSALRGWRGQLSALWGFTIREYFIWQSYRSRQIMWVLDILTNSLIFFILGRLVGHRAAHLLGPYGTNYLTFILIGMILDYFLITNLADPFFRVRRVYFGGTMDLYMLSPMHPHTPMLGLMWRSVFDDYPRAAVIMGCGAVFFGAQFRFDQLGLVLLITLITLVVVHGDVELTHLRQDNMTLLFQAVRTWRVLSSLVDAERRGRQAGSRGVKLTWRSLGQISLALTSSPTASG